jgi:hypothetical protein
VASVSSGRVIEQVLCDNFLLAIILRAEYRRDGIEVFAPEKSSQQLAYMNRPAGCRIAAMFAMNGGGKSYASKKYFSS